MVCKELKPGSVLCMISNAEMETFGISPNTSFAKETSSTVELVQTVLQSLLKNGFNIMSQNPGEVKCQVFPVDSGVGVLFNGITYSQENKTDDKSLSDDPQVNKTIHQFEIELQDYYKNKMVYSTVKEGEDLQDILSHLKDYINKATEYRLEDEDIAEAYSYLNDEEDYLPDEYEDEEDFDEDEYLGDYLDEEDFEDDYYDSSEYYSKAENPLSSITLKDSASKKGVKIDRDTYISLFKVGNLKTLISCAKRVQSAKHIKFLSSRVYKVGEDFYIKFKVMGKKSAIALSILFGDFTDNGYSKSSLQVLEEHGIQFMGEDALSKLAEIDFE